MRGQNLKEKHNPQLEEGYNQKFITFLAEITPETMVKNDDVDEMERRWAHYLRTCIKYDMKIGNMAAYTAIGITKNQADEWVSRNTSNPRRTEFIKKVKAACALYREGLMQDGKVNPVTGIFWQKNYDGFKDQQELVVTPTQTLGDDVPIQEIEDKYRERVNSLEDRGEG